MNILVLNTGSSRLRYSLISMPSQRCIREAQTAITNAKLSDTLSQTVDFFRSFRVDAIGHRIVHGGNSFAEPTILDDVSLSRLRSLSTLDPLHGPSELAAMETVRTLLPDVPAVAVFDTAFHRTLPKVAFVYALPFALAERHELRRYGFHGTSYRFVSDRLQSLADRPSRAVICHLGSGASVCAVRDGKSVDTSMGFTPLEGLAMATRCGDLDPGLVLHLLRESKMTAAELENTLNFESGMKGIAGESGDVRLLEERAERGDARAELALAVFAYRVRKYIGAYAAALGGLDAVAFTGGIGENSTKMRARICAGLEFLGISLDDGKNALALPPAPSNLSANGSTTPVWMIPTNEALQIARETYALLTSEEPIP